MRPCVLLSLLLVLPLVTPGENRARAESLPKDVAYCQLTRDPSKFRGKRIRVRAIDSYMFEVSRLKAPSCCSGPDNPIWVDFDDNLNGESKRLYHKFPKGMGFVLALFTGVIETGGPYGDGGYRAKLIVDRIDKLEATSKGAGHQIPAWVPKNCEAAGTTQQEPFPCYPRTATR